MGSQGVYGVPKRDIWAHTGVYETQGGICVHAQGMYRVPNGDYMGSQGEYMHS